MNTLRPRVIPSLLMSNGRLIKPRNFINPKYVGDPINAVKIFNEKEVDELAIFDVDAWKGAGPNFQLLERISTEARMPLCYGGGVNSTSQAVHLVKLGFEKVSISRASLRNPKILSDISNQIGMQSVVVTLDIKKNTNKQRYEIWIENGSNFFSGDLASVLLTLGKQGVGEFIINSIDREGEMNGYDLELAKTVVKLVNSPVTFLGGAGSVDHIKDLFREVGVVGAGVGSMFVFKGIHRAVLISYSRPSISG